MARPIETRVWLPAVLGFVLISVPEYLLDSGLSSAWKGIGGLLCLGVGAPLLGVGGYRVYRWARGR